MVSAVFVHLGGDIPKHLELNLLRHLDLFSDVEALLITDKEINLRKFRGRVKHWIYKNEYQLRTPLISRDTNFRSGFWKYSLERFYALERYHSHYPEKKLLHIESDVLILPDFPWFDLENQKTLMWNRYNEQLDVAALLYLPNWGESNKFVKCVENELTKDRSQNDMQILRRIAKSKQIESGYFPDSFECGADATGQQNPFKSPGLFDGAAIGMWLTGQNPENNFAITIYHDSNLVKADSTFVKPMLFDYILDDQGNLKASLECGLKVPIFNLHVHSKNLALFRKSWRDELIHLVSISTHKEKLSVFSAKDLIRMLRKCRKPRDFALVIGSHPKLYMLNLYLRRRFPGTHRFLNKIILPKGK